jgi:putative DNA primase/helicase
VTERRPVLVPLDTVQRRDVRWLWRARIPFGRITCLMGDPKVGKSWLALAIAAAVTTGEPLPGETQGRDPAGVLLLTAEDGLEDTVRPRLEDMGADVGRVVVMPAVFDGQGKESFPNLAVDLDALDEALTGGGYGLVIIDPINAYLGTAVDTYRDAHVRAVLGPVATLAERHNVAVLVILHLTKGQRDRAIYRGQGNIAYVAAARVVHLVGVNPENGQRAMVCIGNNLAQEPPALAFDIADGRFRWLGETSVTAASLLAPEKGAEDASKLEAAKSFLRGALADGPVPFEVLQSDARAAGIAERTLRRAKDALDVRAVRTGFGKDGHWTWELPSDGPSLETKSWAEQS